MIGDLAQEALGADRSGDIRPQHLDGHLARVPQVASAIDDRHAAGAEHAVDFVLAIGEQWRGLRLVRDAIDHGLRRLNGPSVRPCGR